MILFSTILIFGDIMKDIALYENIPSIENNFTVKFRIYEKSSALIPHWHEHIELIYILKGSCDFISAGNSYPATIDDLLIANSTEVHSFEAKSDLTFFSILLYPAFFSDVDFRGVSLKNIISDDAFVKGCLSDIRHEYESGEEMSDMMMKSYAYKLIAYLGRNYKRTENPSTGSLINTKRLDSVLEYISKNYTDKITTATLADMCFLSEAHFCRFFKGAVGKSCMEYINQYRVEKAAVLLRNTQDSISYIAERVGFEDINYFSRTFKKIKGLTPGAFRREN